MIKDEILDFWRSCNFWEKGAFYLVAFAIIYFTGQLIRFYI